MTTSSPKCYSCFQGHFKALVLCSCPLLQPLHIHGEPHRSQSLQVTPAGVMPPAALLQTIKKKKNNQSCESSQLHPKAPGHGSVWYLWVLISEPSIVSLWAITHLRHHMNMVSADQQISCSCGSLFSTPQTLCAGPRSGVFQLLLLLQSREGGFSGCQWQEGFQLGPSLWSVPAVWSAEKVQSILSRESQPKPVQANQPASEEFYN